VSIFKRYQITVQQTGGGLTIRAEGRQTVGKVGVSPLLKITEAELFNFTRRLR
jgi:hypothetical protein